MWLSIGTWVSELSAKYEAGSVLELIWILFNQFLVKVDDLVWGIPLIVLI